MNALLTKEDREQHMQQQIIKKKTKIKFKNFATCSAHK